MVNRKNFILIFVLANILCWKPLYAENINTSDSIKKRPDLIALAFYQQGFVLPSNDFVRGNNQKQAPISFFRTASVQIAKQTTGEKLWEQLYGFPRYGFGIYTAQFINSTELGQPVAVYGMFNLLLKQWTNLSLNLDFGAGYSFNWKSFDENKYNIAMGARESAYVDAGPSLEYTFENGVLLDFGASVTHFSNGAMKKPNFGINTVAPKISLGYNLSGRRKNYNYQDVPEFQKKSEFLASFFTGWENEIFKSTDADSVTKYYGATYPVFGLSATFNRQINYKSKIGIGFMVDYFGAANPTISIVNGILEDKHASFKEGLELSIFPSYELVINRFSVLAQEGIYLYRAKYSFLRSPSVYQRLGFKYEVFKDFTIGAYIRMYNYNTSHFIEWTLGHRIHLKHK